MSQVCSQCSHVNPGDASYCYFDGVRLQTSLGNGGPIDAAKQAFPIQFVFPSGLVCRNFDQFATTCQDNWQSAVNLLKQGLLTNFFGGIGRSDLAVAAQEAAAFPDLDRGLDQLLAKLPAQSLQKPKLKVEPIEINLGQLSIGTDRTVQLHLANAGMRLIYGSIASDAKWITLGDAPGSPQKIFQFGAEATIPVQIRGQLLRAGTKPIEGQILVDTNCGSITVTVRGTVPIIPFKEGVLAGSNTIRNLAVLAKAKPVDAAPLFDKGAVAEWFKINGWTYPVQGPAVGGIGSVQQFFEAYGLAKAPKVTIKPQSLALKGAPGQRVEATLEVSTQEKKVVYAHATCDMPWVDVHNVKLAGKKATITVAVPNIPQRPGETLQTKILVAGNGNQRFTVPFDLMVTSAAPAAVAVPSNPFANLAVPPRPPAATPVGVHAGAPPPIVAKQPPLIVSRPPLIATRPPRGPRPSWVHALPALAMVVALFILPIHDWLAKEPLVTGPDDISSLDEVPVDDRPLLVLLFDYSEDGGKTLPKDANPIVHNNLNFGLIMLDLDKKTKDNKIPTKYLLFSPRGDTNNTLVKIDNVTSTFGMPGSGEWVGKPKIGTWPKSKSGVTLPDWYQKEATGNWKVKGVQITQKVEIVPGEPVEVKPREFKRAYDTCLVHYIIENKDNRNHDVGMRVMLDTFIGENDGVPFTISGTGKKTIYVGDFFGDKVPDVIMALENPDLNKPGTVVQLNPRVGKPPSRVSLTRWPAWKQEKNYIVYVKGTEDIDAKKTAAKRNSLIDMWDVPMNRIEDDSCLVMYWDPITIKPSEKRELGYTYGLSSLATSTKVEGGGGNLQVVYGGNNTPGGEFSLLAFVKNPQPGETVTLLQLPEGLSLVSGDKTQEAPRQDREAVTWRLTASKIGSYPVEVKTSSGRSGKKNVTIDRPLIAGGG